MKALVGFWEDLRDRNASAKHCVRSTEVAARHSAGSTKKGVERELFKPWRSPEPHVAPPPSYEESVADLPPDYTNTDGLAVVHFSKLPLEGSGLERKQEHKSDVGLFGRDTPVDLSAKEGIRSHANKKAKKAAKAVQQAKWADSDDEGKKEGDDGGNAGGDGAGGGDAGGGAGGDGGDPPGGGDDGGDGGDDWFGDTKKNVSLLNGCGPESDRMHRDACACSVDAWNLFSVARQQHTNFCIRKRRRRRMRGRSTRRKRRNVRRKSRSEPTRRLRTEEVRQQRRTHWTIGEAFRPARKRYVRSMLKSRCLSLERHR